MYSIMGYGEMIADSVRMDAYVRALRRAVKPGSVVLDIGTGTGIFAVVAYSVLQRTHEIGVRMALGARRAEVLRLVMGHAMKLALMGLAVGAACALALSYALSSELFGVLRLDAAVFAGFTVLLAFVAALAAYIPARRATKVDPMVALRYE